MQYPEYPYPQEETSTAFMYRVYGWMSFALAITASVAYYVFKNKALFTAITTNNWLVMGMIFLQLALVIILSAFIMKLNPTTAVVLFIIYAMSVGVTFSVIFSAYTESSIYTTFLVTAGMFAVTCLYGYFTGADLTSLGSFGFMALIGLILGGLVNLFLRSSGFDFILSVAGVLVFTLLTAYDTQKIKILGQRLMASPRTRYKIAILGALTLYLDFINLFLYMLRFTGRGREE